MDMYSYARVFSLVSYLIIYVKYSRLALLMFTLLPLEYIVPFRFNFQCSNIL